MVDGENAILPIVTFDEHDTWATVYHLAQPELEREGLERLVAALAPSARCVALERQYIDKDYRDTFSHFHSKKFNTPSSRCIRLHFFAEALTRDALKRASADGDALKRLNETYLGYSVIRPTKPNCIGRTLLSPESRGPASAFASLCEERISLLGTELCIRGFPFISQDADVTVCAQSGVWMLLRYFSNRYRLYPETYPFQVSNLTKDYSIGRVYPTAGLYVWQMAEALRRVGFSPVIYTRGSFEKDFEHLLYTYIESGIPVLAGTKDHVVVAFGHRSDFGKALNDDGIIFTSYFNEALVINDDNGVPFQLLHREIGAEAGAHTSRLDFDQIVDFVVPLPEKVFLPAESFRTVAMSILERSDKFGFRALSPALAKKQLILRLFLTSGKSFKKHLTERGMGNPLVEELYRNIPLPHFIWICEISDAETFRRHEILGEIIWDATRNACEPNGWIALHYPEVIVVDIGSALNGSQDLRSIALDNSLPYSVYKHNLHPI